MSYPETEVLNSLVARVFRTEDVTLGEPARGLIARYRGHLLLEDSVAAYDQLAASLQPYDITPLFRVDKGQQIVYLVPRKPDPKAVAGFGQHHPLHPDGAQRHAGRGAAAGHDACGSDGAGAVPGKVLAHGLAVRSQPDVHPVGARVRPLSDEPTSQDPRDAALLHSAAACLRWARWARPS